MTVLASVDRRVLGALRCVDAFSRQQVIAGVGATSQTIDIRRNASGFFVVFMAPGMRDLTLQFDPLKPWPAATGFEVTIRPDGQRYLPRRAQISLPRRPEPMTDPSSSMIPQDVLLYPGPAAVLGFNWAIVRISVMKNGSDPTGPGLPWAVLRLTRDSDGAELATGLCDRRGEGVLAVPGAGQSTNPAGGGAVVTATVDATVTAYFDPGNATQTSQWLPDPDDVLKNVNNAGLKKATQAVKVGRGTLSDFVMPIAV